MLVMQQSGVYLIKYYQWIQVRQEVKHKLKNAVAESELTKITIKLGDEIKLTWFRSNEFSYLGNMFDIVRQTQTDSTTTYFCISDKEEDELFKNLDDLVRNELNQKSNNQNKTDNLANPFYLFFSETQTSIFNLKQASFSYSLFYNKLYISPSLKQHAPPPEFLC